MAEFEYRLEAAPRNYTDTGASSKFSKVARTSTCSCSNAKCAKLATSPMKMKIPNTTSSSRERKSNYLLRHCDDA